MKGGLHCFNVLFLTTAYEQNTSQSTLIFAPFLFITVLNCHLLQILRHWDLATEANAVHLASSVAVSHIVSHSGASRQWFRALTNHTSPLYAPLPTPQKTQERKMGRCCGGGAGARKIARQQLDEVMGRDRNRALTEQQRRASHFSDNEFCKFYLVGFCPYSLFTNTKSDLGVCTKNHSESMRAMWDRIPAIDKASYRYEDDMQTFLEDSVRQVDKIISARKNASAEKEAQILPDAELTRARGELEARIVILEQEQDEYNDDGRFEEARVCSGG